MERAFKPMKGKKLPLCEKGQAIKDANYRDAGAKLKNHLDACPDCSKLSTKQKQTILTDGYYIEGTTRG